MDIRRRERTWDAINGRMGGFCCFIDTLVCTASRLVTRGLSGVGVNESELPHSCVSDCGLFTSHS